MNQATKKKKKQSKLKHGLEIRWALVPYHNQNSDLVLKKRPIVLLQANQNQAKILRVTSHFNSKSNYMKQVEYKIGKFHPLKKNGLTKTSYVDLHNTQTIPKSMLLSHVGYLALGSSSQLLSVGIRYQRQRKNKQLMKQSRHKMISAVPNHHFLHYRRSWINTYHLHNPGHLSYQQSKSRMNLASKRVQQVKMINHHQISK